MVLCVSIKGVTSIAAMPINHSGLYGTCAFVCVSACVSACVHAINLEDHKTSRFDLTDKT